MLLDFTALNYKSFKNILNFDMQPAVRQTGIDYSIQTEIISKKKYKALSSAVIYGPNASGKTNIIGAMDTLKAIVQRGNIKNSDNIITPNIASQKLELIPFCDAVESPIAFRIRFITMGFVFEYSITFTIGRFLDKDAQRVINEESLSMNENIIFDRKNKLQIFIPKEYTQLFNEGIQGKIENATDIASGSLKDDELFLTNGFKSIFSLKLASIITDWFDKKFMVVYRSDSVQIMRKFADPKENTVYVEKTLTEAAKAFGINSNALGYRVSRDGEDAVLCSILRNETYNITLPAEMFESYGTVRFINEFPLIIKALLNGGTLVMDEFDASIHTMALMNIINIFHNDEINKYHAQLIFDTHNPIFLNSNLFRRDEIKFVERDDETHISILYSLSDFKTYGDKSVRKGEDYMRNYFISQYGAIKDVDFSDILKQIIQSKENGKNE